MRAKWMKILYGVAVLTVVLLTGYQPLAAAPPTGEVKTVAAALGTFGIPIPYRESVLANDWMQLLYDHLVGTTPDGKFSPDTGLAHKWEMSRDGLTWTFHLRKGVKFHDGVELTARDVKFSIELFMSPESLSDDSTVLRRDIKSIEVKDPYTVVIHCKQPAVLLISSFVNLDGTAGMVMPKDYFEKLGKDEFAKRPIGSGPYKWHSQMVGSFIKLDATDKHWRDGVPKYKYMTYLVIPEESTRLAMLRTGEADIARISRDSVKDAMNFGLNVMTKESGMTLAFTPGNQWTSPAFSDVRFRKALNLAIDKEAIAKQIFAGLAKPIATWPGSRISAVGGDLTLKPYAYDPQEAKRLVKEGGWEGYEFILVSYARAGCPEIQLVVEALAGYWQAVGLKPKLQLTDFGVFRTLSRSRKTDNMIYGTDDGANPEIAGLLIKCMERYYGKNMMSRVDIPELNEKFERIVKSTDVAEMSKLMAEIYRYAYDQYLMIPICEFPEKIATTKRIPPWNPGVRRVDRNYYDLIKQK